MKRNIGSVLLLLVLVTIFTTSCTRKFCYTCYTTEYTIKYPEQDTVSVVTNSKVHCDHTQTSIKEVEKQGTSHVSYYVGPTLYQKQTATVCEK